MTADADLEQAYRAAVYRLEDGHRVNVGARDPVLDSIFRQRGVATAARLTAANPGSVEPLADAINAEANSRLVRDIDDAGLAHIRCGSSDAAGDWAEEGFLVFGIRLENAKTLGRKYGQRGILWMEEGQPVTLVML